MGNKFIKNAGIIVIILTVLVTLSLVIGDLGLRLNDTEAFHSKRFFQNILFDAILFCLLFFPGLFFYKFGKKIEKSNKLIISSEIFILLYLILVVFTLIYSFIHCMGICDLGFYNEVTLWMIILSPLYLISIILLIINWFRKK